MQGKQPSETAGSGTTGTHGHTPPIDRELKVELLGSLNAAHRALTAGNPKWGPELTKVLDALDAAVEAVYEAARPTPDDIADVLRRHPCRETDGQPTGGCWIEPALAEIESLREQVAMLVKALQTAGVAVEMSS